MPSAATVPSPERPRNATSSRAERGGGHLSLPPLLTDALVPRRERGDCEEERGRLRLLRGAVGGGGASFALSPCGWMLSCNATLKLDMAATKL